MSASYTHRAPVRDTAIQPNGGNLGAERVQRCTRWSLQAAPAPSLTGARSSVLAAHRRAPRALCDWPKFGPNAIRTHCANWDCMIAFDAWLNAWLIGALARAI